MKRAVILVAAGSGSRMGGHVPKQYLELAGKPLIIHTLERFTLFDPEIKMVVVLAPGRRNLWEQVTKSHEIAKGVILAEGGDKRFDSVKKGLVHIEEGCIVGIHDAVRPLVSQTTLARTYDAAFLNGSGIPVLEMEETVRMLKPRGSSIHIDRSVLKRVQTPQVFRAKEIKKAYQQDYTPTFTDDASVYESVIGQLSLVEGNRENIKITTPVDMLLASLLIGSVE
jgi:2-C-methyl-D-erythritol 4-phosphate cytidylyltransferase